MEIAVSQLEEAAAGLEKAFERLDNRREITGAIGEIVRTATDMRFREQKSPDGRPWEPSLRARLTGGKTLSDTGQLRNSINYRADAAKVEIGANVVYARVHQYGGVIKAKNKPRLAFRLADGHFARPSQVTMPARPFLGVSQDDLDEIGEMIISKIRSVL